MVVKVNKRWVVCFTSHLTLYFNKNFKMSIKKHETKSQIIEHLSLEFFISLSVNISEINLFLFVILIFFFALVLEDILPL
jgi:hypothetical protein